MNTPDIVAAVLPVVRALDQLSVGYAVAGSVASSAHGVARSTLDVDLVADLRQEHVALLVASLCANYYIDADAATDAIRRKAMFNVVHLETMLKVDIYILSDRPFDQASFARRRPGKLDDDSDAVAIDTAEDTVLHKLEWFRAGGEVSDRQWGDILGVLRVQGDGLDLDYMHRWAKALGVDDLLNRALRETKE